MCGIETTLTAVNEVLRPLIQEAFEAGKEEGRREAGIDLKVRIEEVLGEVGRNRPRSARGIVKSTVQRLIDDAANGITQSEIISQTGFKPGSVRGTLRRLIIEGSVAKSDGRWFATKTEPNRLAVPALLFRPKSRLESQPEP